MTGADSVDLVRQYQSGDERALEALFARYLPRVRLIVAARMRKSSRQIEDYEDIVQEALIKALGGLERFEVRSDGEFRNWMANCAYSALNDHFRRENAQMRDRRRTVEIPGMEREDFSSYVLASREPSPSAQLRAKELEQRVTRALFDLDPDDLELFTLYRLCGMRYTEIAEHLGYGNPNSLKVAVHRLLKRLETSLSKSDG